MSLRVKLSLLYYSRGEGTITRYYFIYLFYRRGLLATEMTVSPLRINSNNLSQPRKHTCYPLK